MVKKVFHSNAKIECEVFKGPRNPFKGLFFDIIKFKFKSKRHKKAKKIQDIRGKLVQ